MISLLLVKAYIFTLSNNVQGEIESCKEGRFEVVSRLKECDLKIWESQGIVFGKDGGNRGENNDGVGNGIGDIYKYDRQQLTMAPNSVEINVYWYKRHEGIASWITGIVWSKGQDVDKSWRQKIKTYFKWKYETSSQNTSYNPIVDRLIKMMMVSENGTYYSSKVQW